MTLSFTEQEIRQEIIEAILRIAPETDPAVLNPSGSLRDQVDLDSMDFFRLLVSLHEKFKIEIPETDYGKFTTLNAAVDYVSAKLAGGGAH